MRVVSPNHVNFFLHYFGLLIGRFLNIACTVAICLFSCFVCYSTRRKPFFTSDTRQQGNLFRALLSQVGLYYAPSASRQRNSPSTATPRAFAPKSLMSRNMPVNATRPITGGHPTFVGQLLHTGYLVVLYHACGSSRSLHAIPRPYTTTRGWPSAKGLLHIVPDHIVRLY